MSSMKRQRTPFWNVFRRSLTVLVGGTLLCFIADASFAQSPGPSKLEDSLKSFLQHYTGTSAEGKATRYSAAFTDLRGDGIQEALVYLTSDGWCGSGGCTMLVLAPRGSSYTLVTKTTITRLPIRVLTTKSNGWFDLAVRVQGGGIPFGYEAELSFDGKTYPPNPSVLPARKLPRGVAGQVVVPASMQAKPLF